jgi:hypothetical protein
MATLNSLDTGSSYIRRLKEFAYRGLKQMYVPEQKQFVFRFKKEGTEIIPQGLSLRYTAITLLGLSFESESVVEAILGPEEIEKIFDSINHNIHKVDNLGDTALCFWAANAWAIKDRKEIFNHLNSFQFDIKTAPLVELSWVLDALCSEKEFEIQSVASGLAKRIIKSFNPKSSLFPHSLGDLSYGVRSHVTCFADAVYPIHALSHYHQQFNDQTTFATAIACADKICELQGKDGQWWWHYDYRTGTIIEGYPVYSVHQDAMAPMALFAVSMAGGPDYSSSIKRGLDWLAFSPEIQGTLVDEKADLIWRKVARREPGKISRYLQAGTSRIHPKLRVPLLNVLAPPLAIDFENRPYHLGWILYAWPEKRVKEWL